MASGDKGATRLTSLKPVPDPDIPGEKIYSRCRFLFYNSNVGSELWGVCVVFCRPFPQPCVNMQFSVS